jgi:hypothetical protein
MAAAGLSLIVTSIALLGGTGVIPLGGAGAAGSHLANAASTSSSTPSTPRSDPTPQAPARTVTTPTPSKTPSRSVTSARTVSAALPASSGSGRRIVFSIKDQRVWLVNAKNTAFSTYLVSGSLTHNLEPGKFSVFSKSRWAVGVDDSGVMQYFVRFAHGVNAAIGFHSIPTQNGKPLQTVAQLGTPRSHGCIRQKLSDAIRLWDFAPVGTDVVVVA